MLVVELLRCNVSEECTDEKTILDYLRGKYFDLMTNRIRFDSRYFLEESFISESTLTWIDIQTQIQVAAPF